MMSNRNDDNDDDRNNSSNKYFMSTAPTTTTTTTTTTPTIIDDMAAAVPAAIPAAAYRGSSSFTSVVSDENGSCGGGDGGGGGGGGSSVDTDSNYNKNHNNNTNNNTNKNTTNLKRRHDRCDDQEDGTLTEDDDEYKSNRTSSNNSQGTGTTAAASTAANEISSLTQRLNKMSVRDRENATFDLHGIPLDDEYFDASTNDIHIQNNIEKDPAKLELLLDELDHYVNELLIENEKEKKVDGLKKTIGIGLHMAKQQDSNYVYNQRIKFLRADRYDTKLGAARMIRFFDLKKEFFCDNCYNNRNNSNNSNTNSSSSSNSNSNSNNNNNNNVDSNNYDCLGRDLRLSDFSVQDLRLWKQSGFFQLCGMRDRAKRAIVCIFGKALSDYKIDPSLVSRAYLYCCNVWSRDESIQKAGMVVIGYSALTELTPQNDRNIDSNGIFGEYVKNSDPLLGQIVKVGMSGHLRGVARHFCYDHPLLHIQFEKLASHMSSFSAARFRCHYANPTEHSSNSNNITFNPHKELLYILMTFGIPRQTIPINENTGKINVEFHQAILDAIDEREKQDVINNIDNNVDSNYNIDNNVDLDNNNNSIVMSSDQQQHQQKPLNNGAAIEESLWMSLTASISTTTNSSISNMSFSLFPELLKEDDDNNDMFTSFFNDGNDDDDDGGDGGDGGALTDINITNNENNGIIMATAAAAVPATRMSSIYPTDYDVNNTDGPDRINTDGIIEVIRPKSKDIIMGKGQWNKFHPGNIAFKLSLNNERKQYELANRFERMRVVDRMLNELLGIKKHLGGKTSTPSAPVSPSSSVAAENCNNDGGGARFLYKEKKKKITTATIDTTASNDTAAEAKTNHSVLDNHRNDNNKNDDNDKQQQQQYNMEQQYQYEQQQQQLSLSLFEAGPWFIATREKAHDKITHDFRNMRRQTQQQEQHQ